MGFLMFCCIKLLNTIALVVVIVFITIGSAYVPNWAWGFIIAVAIASVFLICWWNEYKQVKRRRDALRQK
jgi:membrane protein implicated in regulation of membrane protease activity